LVVVETTVLDTAAVARLRLALLRVARRLRQRADAGVTPSQLSALVTIDRAGPLPLGDLAGLENISPSTLTRIVNALDDQGLIDRRPDPTDRRVTVVGLSASGRRLLTGARKRSAAYLAARVGSLPAADQEILAKALPVLEKLLEEDA